MSLYDYKISLDIAKHDYPFYALIMAAMRKADDRNIEKLKIMFPEVWSELKERYNSPGGLIGSEVEMKGTSKSKAEEFLNDFGFGVTPEFAEKLKKEEEDEEKR